LGEILFSSSDVSTGKGGGVLNQLPFTGNIIPIIVNLIGMITGNDLGKSCFTALPGTG